MSLLEDVFLQDEANEAEELERVIEGDEFEERRRSDSEENSEKEDEAEEDKRQVDPTKAKTTRVVKNPRFLLNPARLTGPRGIQVIPEHFKDFKFKGKGHEKEDLDLVLKRLEHWAYRLYPKFQFEDCLKKIETLGKKRPVAVHLHKIRSDQFLSEDTVVQKDSSDEETAMPVQEEDEFDKLLQQQIELARSTPAPNSAKKSAYDSSVSPKDKRTTSLMIPKATSSPSINDEQRERMLRSRRLAEERRIARLKNNLITNTTEVSSDKRLVSTNKYPIDHNVENSESRTEQSEELSDGGRDRDEMATTKKHNRSNVIDSSDDETKVETCVSVAVDVHSVNKVTEENDVVDNEKSRLSMVENVESDVIITENCASAVSETSYKIDEGNELIMNENDRIEDNDSVENNVFHINNGNDVPLKFDEAMSRMSGENELRCNSDMNVDLDESNVSVKNNENVTKSINITDTEKNKGNVNEINNIANGLDNEALCCTENTSYIENVKSDSTSTAAVQGVINKESVNTSVEPEEIVDEIMDVDFSDDF